VRANTTKHFERRSLPPKHSRFGLKHHELEPALDVSGWLPFEGLRPGKVHFDSIDLALDRLRQPTLIDDRLSVLQHVVNYWHGPIRPEDGLSDAELAGSCLPAALRWWYRWAGGRPEIMTGQNILLAPRSEHAQPFMRDDRLLFYVENQYVYQWSTLPDGDDPPVFGRYENDEPWEREGMTVSEHLILACLFEAVMCHARFHASAAWLDEDRLNTIAQTISPLAIAPWHWLGIKFFVRKGAFMCAADQGTFEGKKWYSVNVAAKTEHPLRFLKPLLDESWEYVAL
jgi:hypothetical protein